MFYYVYVLESLKDEGRLYIGSTNDLKKRVEQHNRAINFSTKPYIPWRLIFYEAYLNKQDALRRERYLKTSKDPDYLNECLKNIYILISRISTTWYDLVLIHKKKALPDLVYQKL